MKFEGIRRAGQDYPVYVFSVAPQELELLAKLTEIASFHTPKTTENSRYYGRLKTITKGFGGIYKKTKEDTSFSKFTPPKTEWCEVRDKSDLLCWNELPCPNHSTPPKASEGKKCTNSLSCPKHPMPKCDKPVFECCDECICEKVNPEAPYWFNCKYQGNHSCHLPAQEKKHHMHCHQSVCRDKKPCDFCNCKEMELEDNLQATGWSDWENAISFLATDAGPGDKEKIIEIVKNLLSAREKEIRAETMQLINAQKIELLENILDKLQGQLDKLKLHE